MERRILHGNVKPTDIAQALMAEFNRGNLHAQTVGQADKLAVQIVTRWGSQSGGQTALTVSIQKSEDGVMIDIGQQAWLGVAASLGRTAFAALRNPFSLLGRLDDIAQDIESLSIGERAWQVIAQAAKAASVSTELSERLKRITCEFCGSANPIGEASCVACGAPLGKAQPNTCRNCGYVYKPGDKTCNNCHKALF